MLHRHWGELPLIPDTESGIAAIEREQITKPRPLQVEGADLHQPSSRETTSYLLPPECYAVDPITLHTIALIQHAKKIRALLQAAQVQDNKEGKFGENERQCNIPLAPTVPEMNDVNLKSLNMENGIVKSEKCEDTKETFSAGWKDPPKLSSNVARQVLKRAVAVVCAHTGFDGTTESILDMMTDVCHEFYLKLCWQLRATVDREAMTGHTGFVDVMEQALHESGIGGLTALHEFFKTRVVLYHQHLVKQCKHLNEDYEKIRQPQATASEDFKTLKIKEEPVSEIQFPASEEAEDATGDREEAPLQLEELQGALQNMESESSSTLKDEDSMKWPPTQQVKKEANAQSLDPDEEIVIVNDSPPPSDVSMTETLSSPSDPTRLGKPPPTKKRKK